MLSDAFDNYSSIDASASTSIEPSFDADDKYTLVDDNKKNEVVVEDDKYTTVDNDMKQNILAIKANVGEEDEKYMKVDNNLKLNLRGKETNVVEEDEKYMTVDNNLKPEISRTETNVVEQDCKKDLAENLRNDKNIVEDDDKYKLLKEKSETEITVKDTNNTLEIVNDTTSHSNDGPVDDFAEYAVVDLAKKQRDREKARLMSLNQTASEPASAENVEGKL